MNKKTRKLLTWCLVLSMVLTQMLFTNVAFAATRHSGADRYQTALAVVKAGWTTADTAIIARGDDLADALAAAPLAYAKGKAPILLTEPTALPAGVLDELTALGVKNVYIVGGTGAVNADVEKALTDKFGAANVTRVFGASRVETALAVAKAAFPTAPTGAVLVNAYAYADALSVSSIAAAKGMPVLLVDGTMTADVAAYVTGKTVYAVGGTGVISDAVVAAASAKRLAGADRFGTNAAILGEFTFDYSKVFLAKGADANMVDALAGSALAALTDSPIVLVDGTSVAAATAALKANLTDVSEVVALGGAAVLPDSVTAAVEALRPVATELKVESVTAINAKEIVVQFNKDVEEGSVEDAANYTVKVGGTEVNVTPSFDTDTPDKVTLVLDDADAIQAITSVDVEVSKDILDTDLAGMAEDFSTAFVFYDDAAPSIVSAEVDGNTLTVTFDEYVSSIGLLKVDGTAMTEGVGADYDLTTPVKELDIDITDLDLGDGKYTVSMANVADLQDSANAYADANVAGYLSTTFTVSDTELAPKVTKVEQNGSYAFDVEFSKPINDTELTVTAKNGGVDLVESGSLNGDGDVYTVQLDNTADAIDDLYSDGNDAFNLAIAVDGYQAVSNDMFGDKYTTTLKMELDTTGPVLVSGYNKVVDDNTFQLRFDENIADDLGLFGPGVASDITVVNEDGVKLAVLAGSLLEAEDSSGDLTMLTFQLDDSGNPGNALATIDAGTYTVTVGSDTVEDVDFNGNKSFTTTVKVSDAAADDITVDDVQGLGDTIEVTYSDEMGSSALAVANYKLDGASLPAGTAIYFTDTTKTVVDIELPSGSIESDDSVILQISSKVLGSDDQEVASADLTQVVNGLDDNTSPVLTDAEKTSSTEITLTFSEDISAFDFSDFTFKVNGVEITPTADDFTVDTDTVVVTVPNYNTNQNVTVTVVDDPATVVDVAGNALTGETVVTAVK